MWFKLKKKAKEGDKDIDFLIVGLGNPGEKYLKTAHNIGFRSVSRLRKEEDLPHFREDKYLKSLISQGKIEGKEAVLMLPLTFMNRSGEAIKAAKKRFPRSTLLIVHDDSDLLFNTLRFSFARGSAGHKGIESIIRQLKSKDFARLRIGIRKEEGKAEGFVLKKLPPEAENIEEKAVQEMRNFLKGKTEQRTVKI